MKNSSKIRIHWCNTDARFYVYGPDGKELSNSRNKSVALEIARKALGLDALTISDKMSRLGWVRSDSGWTRRRGDSVDLIRGNGRGEFVGHTTQPSGESCNWASDTTPMAVASRLDAWVRAS